MLQVKAKNRVSCEKILSYPFICKKLNEKYRIEIDGKEKNEMLGTIKIPKNLMYLSSHLPKANYSPLKLRKTIGNCMDEVKKGYKTKSIYLSLNLAKKRERNKENSRYRFKSKKLRKRINLPNLNNKKLVLKKEKENKIISSNLNMKLKNRLDKGDIKNKLVQIKSINRLPLTKKYYNPYIKNKKLKKNIKLKPIKL